MVVDIVLSHRCRLYIDGNVGLATDTLFGHFNGRPLKTSIEAHSTTMGDIIVANGSDDWSDLISTSSRFYSSDK